jgi:hypothetical protein
MQGLLMVHNSELQYGNGKVPPGAGDRSPCVMMLPGGFGGSQFSLGPKLLSMLEEEVEEYDGDPNDFERRFRYGDPVALATGRYIRMFQKGADPRERYQAQPQARGPLSFQKEQQQAATKEIAGYEIHFDTELPDGTPACLDTPEWADTIREKWIYWEEGLDFPTYTQQAHLLNKVFPANAIVFAYENYNRDWITETTWDNYLKRESASVPAVPPGARRYGDVQPPQAARQAAPVQVLLPAPSSRYQPPPPPVDSNPAARGFSVPARRAVVEPIPPEPGDHWGFPPEQRGGYAPEEPVTEGSFDDDLSAVPAEYQAATESFPPEPELPATPAPRKPAPAPRQPATPPPPAPAVVPVTPRPPARRTTAVPDVVAPVGIPDAPAPMPPAAAPSAPRRGLSPTEVAAKKAAEIAARSRS